MPDQSLADVLEDRSVAIVLTCRNAGLSVAATVLGFQRALPGAEIIIIDNQSDDHSAQMARAAGARVVRTSSDEAAHALRQSIVSIDADLCILASADGSHDPDHAPMLINALLRSGADVAAGNAADRETVSAGVWRRLARSFAQGVSHLLGRDTGDPSSVEFQAFTKRFGAALVTHWGAGPIEAAVTAAARTLRSPVIRVSLTCTAHSTGPEPERIDPAPASGVGSSSVATRSGLSRAA